MLTLMKRSWTLLSIDNFLTIKGEHIIAEKRFLKFLACHDLLSARNY